MHRRNFLNVVGGALTVCAPVAGLAQNPTMTIVIPANAGGGWDETGRAFGTALMASKAVDAVNYENKGGKGGTVGLTHFVERYSRDGNALMIGGMVMTGAIAVQKPTVDLERVTPIARLTGEFDVIVVPPSSKFRNLTMLADAMRTDLGSVRFTGGSAGGVDHFLLGLIVRKANLDASRLNYTPRPNGKEGLQALQAGQADVLVKSYSECKDAIDSGAVRALGISSSKAMFGIPPLRSADITVEISNWRGVFAAGGLPAERVAALQGMVKQTVGHPSWLAAVKQHNWANQPLIGADFKRFVDVEQTTARAMAYMLKLKA
jgi:putative tricarboxylic transport membrane protein